MKKLLAVVLLVLVAAIASVYFGDDHQRFIAFSKERDAWHRRCDVYRATKVSDDDARMARACQQELDALVAYAARQGWN